MNIFTKNTSKINIVPFKSIGLKILILTLFCTAFVRPSASEGAIIIVTRLLIIDYLTCSFNVVFDSGCDDGGGGGGGAAETITYSYESDYPGTSSSEGGSGGSGGTAVSASGQPITRMSATRDSLKDPCTTGDTCPGDDLEELAAKISVNPAYAASATNKCPLFWTQGQDETNSIVECKLVTNGTSELLSKSSTNENIFNVPVGRHVLSCTRTTTEIVTKYGTNSAGTKTAVETQTNTWSNTEDYNVRCLPRPNVIEQ